jgi:hypothetical protein
MSFETRSRQDTIIRHHGTFSNSNPDLAMVGELSDHESSRPRLVQSLYQHWTSHSTDACAQDLCARNSLPVRYGFRIPSARTLCMFESLLGRPRSHPNDLFEFSRSQAMHTVGRYSQNFSRCFGPHVALRPKISMD